MKSLKAFCVGCLLALWVVPLSAQDIHFSQFYLSPLNLNPALTGVMNCNSRVVANYRNQWSSVLRSNAFSTYSVSYDQRIAAGRYDYFGVGGTFWGDSAGEANFQTFTGKVSLSYSKKMGGRGVSGNYLVFGAEAGMAQRSLDFLNLRWGTQHDGQGGFNPNLDSQENSFDRDNFTFVDMAAGLLWFSVFDENQNFYAGFAFHHLNRPDQSFSTEEDDLLFSRYTAHAGGEFLLSDNFGLVPGVIFMSQGPSYQVNAGTSFKFLLDRRGSSNQAFQVGIWARMANNLDTGTLTDAVILSTRFDFNQFSLGFSYDINISPLQPASNSQGSFEFAMVYKICGSRRTTTYCPEF